MKKHAIITLVVIAIIVVGGGGYYYFKTTYEPRRFVQKFFEQLEFKGVKYVNSDFFVSEYLAKPEVSWQEYYANTSTDTLAKEQHFQIWKRVYLRRILDYVDVEIGFPDPILMSDKKFDDTYKNISFREVQLKYIEIDGDYLKAAAYASVKHTGSSLTDLYIGGDKTLELIAKRGRDGWKIVAFAIRI